MGPAAHGDTWYMSQVGVFRFGTPGTPGTPVACNGLVMGRREHTQANYYNFSTSMIECTAGLTVPRKNAELPKLTPVFKHGGTKLKR